MKVESWKYSKMSHDNQAEMSIRDLITNIQNSKKNI